uniref:Cytochrome c biogenesis protein CcsA n=1 Tax=Polysiphonia sertularioides TaxID=945028 RepID=A0A1Z1MG13_9FLOR|nr:cytochrome c biogenesis protein ccs1 [Polysiphonia sertularioides]
MNINLIENTLINVSFGLLIVNLLCYWLKVIINGNESLNSFCNALAGTINLLIASSLAIRWMENKYFPLSNLYESLIFLGWCITLIQIVIEKKTNNRFVGPITTPAVLFIIGFATMSLPKELQTASPLIPALKSNWLMMHVTVMILSYATLMIGSLLSLLFLVISDSSIVKIEGNSNNNSRKILFRYKLSRINNIMGANQETKKVNRIELTQLIDNISYRTIGLGFPLLTIGIISGAVWANEAWGTYWSWDPKETWALITWIVFAIYLHSRINNKLDGRRPAIIASLGFVIIWICYLGVNFLGKGLHNYGWLVT